MPSQREGLEVVGPYSWFPPQPCTWDKSWPHLMANGGLNRAWFTDVRRRGGDQVVLVFHRTQPSPAEPSRSEHLPPLLPLPPPRAPGARPPPAPASRCQPNLPTMPGAPPASATPQLRSARSVCSTRAATPDMQVSEWGTQSPYPEGADSALPSASSAPFVRFSPLLERSLARVQSPRAPFHRALHPSAVLTTSYHPGAAVNVSVTAFSSSCSFGHPPVSGPFSLWVLPWLLFSSFSRFAPLSSPVQGAQACGVGGIGGFSRDGA